MIWVVGAGIMAAEYVKVLKALKKDFKVIGNGLKSAKVLADKEEVDVITGGLEKYLLTNPQCPDQAIICTPVELLAEVAISLIRYGVASLLVEKPGGLDFFELSKIEKLSSETKAQVYIAYNRRFYSSVIKAQELIKLDGGVSSFNFELTEWAHVIEALDKDPRILAKWFLCNSTHVADLAFFLGGRPKQLSSYTSGGLGWHSSSSVFSGAGLSELGALFSYGANWESAGRWSVDVLTNKNRYIFRPIEALQVQRRGSIEQEFLGVDDLLDQQFKPGLYRQLEAFLGGRSDALCSIEEQCSMYAIYEQMAGYSNNEKLGH